METNKQKNKLGSPDRSHGFRTGGYLATLTLFGITACGGSIGGGGDPTAKEIAPRREAACCSLKDLVAGVGKVSDGINNLRDKLIGALGYGAYEGAVKVYQGVEYIWKGSLWLAKKEIELLNAIGAFGAKTVVGGVEYVSDGLNWLTGPGKDLFLEHLAKSGDAATLFYAYPIQNAPADLFGWVWNTELRVSSWKGLFEPQLAALNLGYTVFREGQSLFARAEFAEINGLGSFPAVFISPPLVDGGEAAAWIYVGQTWIFKEYGVRFPFFKKETAQISEPPPPAPQCDVKWSDGVIRSECVNGFYTDVYQTTCGLEFTSGTNTACTVATNSTAASGCGGLTYEGFCSGTDLNFCCDGRWSPSCLTADNKILVNVKMTVHCADRGMRCGNPGLGDGFNCM